MNVLVRVWHSKASKVAMVGLLATTMSACQLGGISGSSTCADYIKASAQDEQELVMTLYHQAHPSEPASSMGAVNAVMNVNYECQQAPSKRVGDLSVFKR